jgi:hypothetical protein
MIASSARSPMSVAKLPPRRNRDPAAFQQVGFLLNEVADVSQPRLRSAILRMCSRKNVRSMASVIYLIFGIHCCVSASSSLDNFANIHS